MNDAVMCSNCDSMTAAQESVCAQCGEPLSPDSQAIDTFEWTDGSGLSWQINASPDQFMMEGSGGRYAFTPDRWRSVLSFSPLGGRVVIHVDTGDREIGFMVPQADAEALAQALGLRRAGVQPSPVAQAVAKPVASAPSRGPTWPKMTAAPLVALSLSVLTFLPVVGAVFAVATYVFAALALRQTRDNAAFRHVRLMARISLVFATVGLGICALTTYTMWHVTPEAAVGMEPDVTGIKWSIGSGIAAFLMVIFALSFHEAGHAISAWWCGDDYAKSQGRVTLNPLAHIDPFGTVLLPLMLMYLGFVPFGYAKPVPVRLGHVRRFRRAHILISIAGPASNLMQAAICLGLLLMIGSLLAMVPGVQVSHLSDWEPIVEISGVAGGKILGALALMLKIGFGVNVLLAFFNLIPVPPLDGSWILEHLFPKTLGRLYAAIRPYGFMLFLALIYWGSGVLIWLMLPAVIVLWRAQELIWKVTGF